MSGLGALLLSEMVRFIESVTVMVLNSSESSVYVIYNVIYIYIK